MWSAFTEPGSWAVLQYFERWLPRQVKLAPPDTQVRALFLVILAFVTGVGALGFGVLVLLTTKALVEAGVLFSVTFTAWATPFAFRRFGYRVPLSYGLILVVKAALSMLAFTSGGLFSSAVLLNVLFPFVAAALISIQAGIGFAGLVIAEVLIFYLLYRWDVPLPVYDVETEHGFMVLSFALTSIVLMVTGLAFDVLRRRASVVQVRMERELVVARRLGELGELAGEIAHELNNPLSYTIANLEQLLHELRERETPPESIEESIEDALAGALSVKEQVAGLIARVNAERTRIDSTDLSNVVERAVDTAVELNDVNPRPTVLRPVSLPRVRGQSASLDAIFFALAMESLRQIQSALEVSLDEDGPWVCAVFRHQRGSRRRRLREGPWHELEGALTAFGAELAVDRRAGEVTVRLPRA